MVLALAASGVISAHAATGGQVSPGPSLDRQGARLHGGASFDERVKTLSQTLDLSTAQQSGLRKLLEGQREQVRRVWGDASVDAAYRIRATQAISDRTADQVRALLNEEQRKKYILPRRPATTGSARGNVESWVDAAKPK